MIYTVNGTITKDEMKATLSHEHFKWENDETYGIQLYFDKKYDDEKIEETLDKLLPVLQKLYDSGCRTIVEASPPIGGQDLKLLKKLSSASKINIIPCTGHNLTKYVYRIHNENFAEQLAEQWIKDFEFGLDTIDGVTIKPGHLKLLLDRGKLSDVDREMLRAAIMTNKKTGLPIHCHILESALAEEVMDLLEKEGADFGKFLWAHTIKDKNDAVIKRALRLGIWLGIDMIKTDAYEYNMNFIKEGIKCGFENRILLSQDYDFFEEVTDNGANHPCAAFFTDFIPYCINSGISSDVLERIISKNPAEFYDF
ncbi:MAG: php [Anaerocolumna sp.]|jgi:phosphotriesterase-related protein|nr:php [Anaerocolumna sp.]